MYMMPIFSLPFPPLLLGPKRPQNRAAIRISHDPVVAVFVGRVGCV